MDRSIRRSRSPSLDRLLRTPKLTRSPLRTLDSPRFSQDEVDELTSPFLPYRTGYTYAKSMAYRSNGPDSYEIPNMSGNGVQSSDWSQGSYRSSTQSEVVDHRYRRHMMHTLQQKASFLSMATLYMVSVFNYLLYVVSTCIYTVTYPVRTLWQLMVSIWTAVVHMLFHQRKYRRVSISNRHEEFVYNKRRSVKSPKIDHHFVDSDKHKCGFGYYFVASIEYLWNCVRWMTSIVYAPAGYFVSLMSSAFSSSEDSDESSNNLDVTDGYHWKVDLSRSMDNNFNESTRSSRRLRSDMSGNDAQSSALNTHSAETFERSSSQRSANARSRGPAVRVRRDDSPTRRSSRLSRPIPRLPDLDTDEGFSSGEERASRVTVNNNYVRRESVERNTYGDTKASRFSMISRVVSALFLAIGWVIQTVFDAFAWTLDTLWFLCLRISEIEFRRIPSLLRNISSKTVFFCYRKIRNVGGTLCRYWWIFPIILLLLLLAGGRDTTKNLSNALPAGAKENLEVIGQKVDASLDSWMVSLSSSLNNMNDGLLLMANKWKNASSDVLGYGHSLYSRVFIVVWNLFGSIFEWMFSSFANVLYYLRQIASSIFALICSMGNWLLLTVFGGVSRISDAVSNVHLPSFGSRDEEIVYVTKDESGSTVPVTCPSCCNNNPPQVIVQAPQTADLEAKILANLAASLEPKVTTLVDTKMSSYTAQLKERQKSVSSETHSFEAKHAAEIASLTRQIELLKAAQDASQGSKITVSSELDWNHLDDRMRAIAREEVAVYDADKTGLPDYALESAGGQVLTTRCSETYEPSTRLQSYFGIPFFYTSYSPRVVIQGPSLSMKPGECWCFKGGIGFIAIKLSSPIKITSISYEHVRASITRDKKVLSAPKDFTVWSYLDEKDVGTRVKLGDFRYDNASLPLQFFEVKDHPLYPVPIIEMQVDSNHGSPFTCLYRLRVHGESYTMENTQSQKTSHDEL